jgi:hypothetical protein
MDVRKKRAMPPKKPAQFASGFAPLRMGRGQTQSTGQFVRVHASMLYIAQFSLQTAKRAADMAIDPRRQ